MAERSLIEWTDATWNPITGCTLVSEGCRYCYAAHLAATRLKHTPSRQGLARMNADGAAKFTGEVRFNETWLLHPLRWRKPSMIFVCAHGDLFHPDVPDDWIDQVFVVMAMASHHTFQVLTKRPARAREYLANAQLPDADRWAAPLFKVLADHTGPASFRNPGWPLPNLWLGTSVEDQATADARIPQLLAAPAAVRFISAEPLLGQLDLRGWIPGDDGCELCEDERCKRIDIPRSEQCPERWEVFWNDRPGYGDERRHLDWVIVGGESGKHARPMNPQWARDIRDQCVAADTPFFFKQWGEWVSVSEEEGDGPIFTFPDGRNVRRIGKKAAGRRLDGVEWNQMPKGVTQ